MLMNWVYILLLMILAWIIFLKIQNPGIVDAFWPISILISGAHYVMHSNLSTHTVIQILLLFIWALRLSLYLFATRIIPNIIEKRYESVISNDMKNKKLHFFIHFQFQGILAMIIAIPFYFLDNSKINSILFFLLSFFILMGIICESISDIQLQNFRKENPGMVCNIGFWKFSRHPNYFFEWVIWMCFALASFNVSSGWLSLISPFLLLVLMLKFTIPITESASIKSKKDAYLSYQNKTPVFLPIHFGKKKSEDNE